MVHFKKPTTSAGEIAEAILVMARRDGVSLDPPALQKLLYYAQAWALLEHDQPLFRDRIEAWREGPVVHDVYQTYRGYGSQSIDSTGIDEPALTEDDRLVLESVWSRYGHLSGPELSRKTHNEEPWLKAWGDRGPGDASKEGISFESMRAYFSNRLTDAQNTLADLLDGIIDEAE